ncbi:two-component response regulator [Nostoc sp. PCC 7120 = FACHB-418]|nr:two-component response regulator [Nostoc sp. PCC 7120 = FACHB-418]
MSQSLVRVLLVDDGESDYILTCNWFSEFRVANCKLEWVDNYEAAKVAIAKNQHDIYLVDYRLGSRSGLELLREAIADGCTSPIILLTGQGDGEIDIEAMKAGAVDYLEKNQLNAPLLERSILYAIERKQTEKKSVNKQRCWILPMMPFLYKI